MATAAISGCAYVRVRSKGVDALTNTTDAHILRVATNSASNPSQQKKNSRRIPQVALMSKSVLPMPPPQAIIEDECVLNRNKNNRRKHNK